MPYLKAYADWNLTSLGTHFIAYQLLRKPLNAET